MHKYNKIRGILRAKQGSQIPKYLGGHWIEGSGGMMLDGYNNRLDNLLYSHLINPHSVGSLQPTGLFIPQVSNLLGSNPIGDLTQSNITAAHNYINNNLDSRGNLNAMQEPLSPLELVKNASSKSWDLPTTLPNNAKIEPSFWQKTKIVGKGLGKKIGNFANENQLLVQGGINMVSDKLFGGTENSSEFNTIDGALGTLQSVGGPVGWYATAAKVGLNAINKIGAKEIEGHTMNTYLKSKAGNYGGLLALNSRVEADKDKEFGTFNRGGYKRALGRADKLFAQLGTFENIVNTADNQFAMAGNDIYLLGYEMLQNGGYPTQFLRASKQGGTLTQKIDIVKSRKFNQVINVDTKLVEEFKEGGKLEISEWEPVIELFEEWEPEIILEVEEFQKGGKTRTLEELIEYAKKENPRFIQRLSESPRGIKFTDDEGNEGEGSHYLEWSTDDFGNAVIYPRIQEIEDGSLKFFPSNEAYLRAIKTKNVLTMSPEEANTFFSEDSEYKTAYKRGWPNFFKLFKDGGKTKEELETPKIEETSLKNLIPEGALHKNKHHMEHTEGLTQKGIPVVDNEGEQLAEIELDEIIFTLEVTKKLEELYKEGTDEAAIEAGKLLVKEILFNTDDRTGLIAKCEEGGKICQKQ